MLSDAEIVSARETANRALPDSAEVSRKTTVSDGGGGTTESWLPAGTVACRISPAGGGEGPAPGAQLADESTHVITMPAETDVTESDRLVVSGVTYEVLLVRKRGEWEITRRVEVKERP